MSINELKDAFFSLQTRKSPSHDEISFDVIKSCFGSLSKPLLHIFRSSLEEGIFPDDLKPQLLLFLRLVMKMILETIGQSLFYLVFPKYLRKSCIKGFSIIYQSTIYFTKNSLVFSNGTEHAIMQLIDQINDTFDNNCFTLGIFIDVSKAFDAVDHQILIS